MEPHQSWIWNKSHALLFCGHGFKLKVKVWTAVYLFQVSKEIIKDEICQKNILFVQLRKRTENAGVTPRKGLKKSPDLKYCPSIPSTDAAWPAEFFQHFISYSAGQTTPAGRGAESCFRSMIFHQLLENVHDIYCRAGEGRVTGGTTVVERTPSWPDDTNSMQLALTKREHLNHSLCVQTSTNCCVLHLPPLSVSVPHIYLHYLHFPKLVSYGKGCTALSQTEPSAICGRLFLSVSTLSQIFRLFSRRLFFSATETRPTQWHSR